MEKWGFVTFLLLYNLIAFTLCVSGRRGRSLLPFCSHLSLYSIKTLYDLHISDPFG